MSTDAGGMSTDLYWFKILLGPRLLRDHIKVATEWLTSLKINSFRTFENAGAASHTSLFISGKKKRIEGLTASDCPFFFLLFLFYLFIFFFS